MALGIKKWFNKFLLGILAIGLVSLPTFALPYKTPPENIPLKVLDESSYEDDIVKIEKFLYKFKYCKRFGKGYGYEITNKTEDDLILVGVVSEEFFNKDMNGTRISPIKYLIIGNFTTGFSYIPYYGLFYRLKVKLEERLFLRDFPKDYEISPDETIKILLSAPKKSPTPQAEFIFNLEDKEFKVKF